MKGDGLTETRQSRLICTGCMTQSRSEVAMNLLLRIGLVAALVLSWAVVESPAWALISFCLAPPFLVMIEFAGRHVEPEIKRSGE